MTVPETRPKHQKTGPSRRISDKKLRDGIQTQVAEGRDRARREKTGGGQIQLSLIFCIFEIRRRQYRHPGSNTDIKNLYDMKLNTILAGICLIMAASCGQPEKENSMKNQVIENIMSRRSIRAYKDTPVGRDPRKSGGSAPLLQRVEIGTVTWSCRCSNRPAQERSEI